MVKLSLHLGSFMLFIMDSGISFVNNILDMKDLEFTKRNEIKFWIVFSQLWVAFFSQIILAHIVFYLCKPTNDLQERHYLSGNMTAASDKSIQKYLDQSVTSIQNEEESDDEHLKPSPRGVSRYSVRNGLL